MASSINLLDRYKNTLCSSSDLTKRPSSKCQNCIMEIPHKEGNEWKSKWIRFQDLDENICGTQSNIIFTGAAGPRDCPNCHAHFTSIFTLPEDWWTPYSRRSNGHFGCENIYDKERNFQSHNTWFRFLIKQIVQQPLPNEKDYRWYKFNIFTRWFPNGESIILSFDTPPVLRPQILQMLDHGTPKQDPYWVHLKFLHEMVALQDQAVWSVRNVVRETELTRTSSSRPDPQYPRLHDNSRHAIHVEETLDVSTITIQNILVQHAQFCLERPAADDETAILYEHTTKRIHFYQQMVQSLKCRSQSNKERLLNEITLAFNTVAQYDSRISVQIGQEAQVDSAAMKTIAFLTLAFLPATFISAIFSMTFFNFTPAGTGEPEKWSVSSKFWLYWVVALPLSCATVGLWLFWHRFFPVKRIGE